MRNNAVIQLSPPRIYVGAQTIGKLGEEAKQLGERALILTDENVWLKVEKSVDETLGKWGILYETLFFKGYCSMENCEKIGEIAARQHADMVVGVGGGRLLDAAKIASDLAHLRSITIPTSAATCAAAAWLSVKYSEQGALIGNYWTQYPPFATILDSQLISKDCPKRYNFAGIVDAMAKYPEIRYNLVHTTEFEINTFSETALNLAKENYYYFISNQQDIQKKFQGKVNDAQVENIFAKSIAITGLISSLSCGGKQAAISHSLYHYICCKYPDVTEKFLHGEIVGASLCYQLIVADFGEEEIRELKSFLLNFGMPICLKELGIVMTKTEETEMFEFLKLQMGILEEEMIRIRGYKEFLL